MKRVEVYGLDLSDHPLGYGTLRTYAKIYDEKNQSLAGVLYGKLKVDNKVVYCVEWVKYSWDWDYEILESELVDEYIATEKDVDSIEDWALSMAETCLAIAKSYCGVGSIFSNDNNQNRAGVIRA